MGCIQEEEHDEDHDHDARRGRRHERLLSAALGMAGMSLLRPEQDMVLAANVTKTRLRMDDAAQAEFLQAIKTPGGVMELSCC